jgi:hypothetical protein
VSGIHGYDVSLGDASGDGRPDGREEWSVVMHNIGTQEGSFWAIAYCVSMS